MLDKQTRGAILLLRSRDLIKHEQPELIKVPLNESAVRPPTASSEEASELLRLEFRRNLGKIFRQSDVFFLGSLITMGGWLLRQDLCGASAGCGAIGRASPY